MTDLTTKVILDLDAGYDIDFTCKTVVDGYVSGQAGFIVDDISYNVDFKAHVSLDDIDIQRTISSTIKPNFALQLDDNGNFDIDVDISGELPAHIEQLIKNEIADIAYAYDVIDRRIGKHKIDEYEAQLLEVA